jgi:hypothetical protein
LWFERRLVAKKADSCELARLLLYNLLHHVIRQEGTRSH